MSKDLLERLLAGAVADPDTGETIAPPIRSVVIGRSLGQAAPDLLRPLDLGRRIALVMDPDTRSALGEAVAAALRPCVECAEVLLPRHPHPDMGAVERVTAETREADALVAVGSGSINDIAKYAAFLSGKPYAVFGTAASMNGYTSASAAITDGGLKKSLPARLPRGAFLDIDVIAAAPPRLAAAGFGDSMARSTAQTDWLLSHLLLGTPYRELPFALLRADEDALVAGAAPLREGDIGTVELLTRTLVLSGLGMTISGGSYPASQGEHLIAHYIDMLGRDLPPALHGEHIAVTTLTMARLQERVLALPSLALSPSRERLADFVAAFGEALGRACWEAYRPKLMDAERTSTLNARLAADWPSMRAKLSAVRRSAAEIEAALLAVGAPTAPDQVGIPAPFYREAVVNARRIRDRYTMLDLAYAAGGDAMLAV